MGTVKAFDRAFRMLLRRPPNALLDAQKIAYPFTVSMDQKAEFASLATPTTSSLTHPLKPAAAHSATF